MKMRDLERRTGVGREAVRVYLRLGLLPEPRRPKRNVADYGEEHVRGILAIRQLQRDRRLPLAQIKRAMEGDTLAVPSDAAVFPHLESLVAARLGIDNSLVPLASVTARNPHAEADARALERVGAVRLRRQDGELRLSREDAQIVAIWGDMRALGFTEEHNLGPEFVRIYREAAERLAATEVKLFLAGVQGHVGEESAAEMAQKGMSHTLGLFSLLRMKAVLRELPRAIEEIAARRTAALDAPERPGEAG
ncbi:MAG: MerR family transcriptional regulator [Nevskia sp.]|nr:MerR family transcriptional regulator [Nevskia sp.]